MGALGMNNEGTKEQLRRWMENTVRKATNPDPKERAKVVRATKKKKIAKRYGF